MRTILVVAMLISVTVAGTERTPAPGPAATTPALDSEVTLSAWSPPPRVRRERRVIKIVNNKRAKKTERTGKYCPALKERRNTLRKAARRHSWRMSSQMVLSHRLSNEPSLGVRVTKAGYRHWRRVGENIAMSSRYGGAWTPRQVVRAWMRSPGHRRNMLNCHYRHIGVGLVQRDGRRWWTQDFGRKW